MGARCFRNWSIKAKIVSITAISMAALMLGAIFFVLPYFGSKMVRDKETATRHIVEVAIGIMEHHDAEAKAGKTTMEEARKLAMSQISRLRYEGKEYLWIHDLGKPVPTMIMHPTVPALNGKVLDDPKFNKATLMREGIDGKVSRLDMKNLFVSMNEVVEKAGHGFVNYEWPKPKNGGGTTSELYTKLSYVKKFEPWGWVLGSGIYIDDIKEERWQLALKILGATLLFAIFSLLMAASVARGVTLPMKKLVESLEEMAVGEGDLTRRMDTSRKDETGLMASAFNRFIENLHGIISQVSSGTSKVHVASDRLHDTAERISSNSSEVALQASSVATAVEQMSATSQNIAHSCSLAYDNANRACNTAKNGSEIVNKAVASIQAIAERVQETANTVSSLGQRSDQIGQIIGTIEDIADQTNLLALNAAIEAARAGEMGRGFAVVADEVRALAERTTRATREIGEMIKVIQQETNRAVQAMEAGVLEVERGTGEAARSGDALQEILSQISDVTSQLNQISTAAEEQTSTTNTISSNMHRILNTVDLTVESSKETSKEATELAHMAGGLSSQIAKFKI